MYLCYCFVVFFFLVVCKVYSSSAGALHLIWNSSWFQYDTLESQTPLFNAALAQLVPWVFFTLDRAHCSRWLPIHIRDMLELQHKPPIIHKEFVNGNFTAQKTLNTFSAIVIDQSH